MKAIVTKYHGPRNTRGSRISATDSDKNRVIVSIDHELNNDDNHKAAALALCRKMGWSGKLAEGYLAPGQHVYVWVADHTTFTAPVVKYEIQVHNGMDWDNDIAGCTNGTQCDTLAEAKEDLAHLKSLWPDTKFRIAEISVGADTPIL